MAQIDLGQFEGAAAPSAQERQLRRTQTMLCATAVASVSIVVVAALFLTMF